MIDIPTLIGCSVALFAVLGVLFLGFWIREGRSQRSLSFGLPFLMGFLGGACLLNTSLLPGPWSLRLGMVFILLAYGFGWQAIRAFDRRPFRWAVVFLPILAWAVLSALLLENLQLAALSASLRAVLVVFYNALAARELWRRRGERLPSRVVLFWVFAFYAGLAALRVPFTAWLPTPLGAAATAPWAVVLFNLGVVTQALLVSAFLISMLRERVAMHHYHLATRDPLTGVYNRRAFDERAGAWMRQMPPPGTASVALLLFDIDHFKSINDRFGHGVGDSVIILAARAAERELGPEDTLFRIGGEEFVCVLPDATDERALEVAENVRRAFEALAFEVEGVRVEATISIGIATGPSDGAALPSNLLVRADRALYGAKDEGRNRTILSRSATAHA
jgi:diguanylate cyclase (GGDEF)-like protein